ncbi:MAG: type II secretion system protein [Candidatus Pacebacteria bacterium]|nr:type II secretion system protein [Candidatus Paceibacterota bacterium]
MRKKSLTGFTLVELMIVIALIGIFAGTVLIASRWGIDQSRDARRTQEIFQIMQGLNLYRATYGIYPDNTDINDAGCDLHGVVWDEGNSQDTADDFIKPLMDENFMTPTPREWKSSVLGCTYRYAKIQNPCDGQCQGTYAILYAACEADKCPVNERPACCEGSSWTEGAGEGDKSDIILFLKEK